MPLGLIRKLAARLIGGRSTTPPPAAPARRATLAPDRPRTADAGRGGRRPQPDNIRPADRTDRRPARGEPRLPAPGRPAGSTAPSRGPATGGPATDGQRPASSNEPRRGDPRRARTDAAPRRDGGQRDDRRDDRRDGGRRDERQDRRGGRPAGPGAADHRLEQGHTPRGEERPGGAIVAEEVTRRHASHAAWDPASFQVPPVEGKKRFQDFDLPPEIMHAVADAGFQYCTPIQALSLEHALAGRNVAGRAQTGTGKTAAFLVALLARYLRQPAGRSAKPGTPRALVIAPTRELVIQISRDADTLGRYCGLRYLAVYGGMDHERQRREIEAGPLDLLVATPGRLLDYAHSHVVDLSQVDTLVIDEADRMLDMGFIPDVRRIVHLLPPPERRCTMLYSATLNDDVMRLAAQWMTAPVRVDIENEHVAVDTVTQQVYVVAARDKITLLINLLRRHADRRVLVFCNRRVSTERVADKLQRAGIVCEMLSGDVQQNRRLRALDDFRSGKVRVVVATDVAGRGIHVDDIGFVINFDFPYEPEDYVHRIGRTGRAGHAGTAISFADENESFAIPEIEKFIGEPLKCVQPEDELLRPIHERSERRTAEQPPRTRVTAATTAAPAPAEPVAAPAGHAPEWPEEVPVAPLATTPAVAPASAPVAPPAAPTPKAPVAPSRPRPASASASGPATAAPAAARPPRPAASPVTPVAPSAVRRSSEEWVPGGRR